LSPGPDRLAEIRARVRRSEADDPELWTQAVRDRAWLADRVEELAGALEAMTERYTGLIESGDCGFWDVEGEEQVASARAALARLTEDG
jgi:hypothetical protein